MANAGAGLPGVKVGPLDPDATSQFGHVAAQNSARQLIRFHSQAYPADLVRALARPLDDQRTKGLQLDEVRHYLSGLTRDNDDPIVPAGARVVGAAVHGHRDAQQVLTFTYALESGRTGKWYAPYGPEDLPDSYQAGSELVKVQEMKDRGVVAWDTEGTTTEILRRRLAESNRQNRALRAAAEGTSDELPGEDGDEPGAGDVRDLPQVAADHAKVVQERDELRAKLAQYEAMHSATGGGMPLAGAEEIVPGPTVATENEPIDGYDDLKADEAAKVLRSEDTSPETRERILAYERTHANRATVTRAGDEALGRAG